MSAFENREVSRVAAREFWFEGEPVGGHGPLYLELTDGTKWVVAFNDGPERWEFTSFLGDFPVAGHGIGDDEMQWKDVEPAVSSGLVGMRIAAFDTYERGPIARAILRLDNGTALEFTYDCRAEVATVNFR